MNIIKVENKEALSIKAKEMFVDVLQNTVAPILGLATGSTPEGMYKLLIESYQNGDISFKNALAFNLDEYVGLAPDHPASYRYYMQHKLYNHVDTIRTNTFLPNGLAEDLDAECITYEKHIQKAGNLDFLVLGIGENGHIGFNEPGTSFESRTHIVTLTENTREVNARFFDSIDEVPTEALTMGLGTIMDAKQIMLLVQGERKREILKEVIYGEVTEEVPASILQKHPNVTIITDLDV